MPQVLVRVQGQINWSVQRGAENWIAVCEPLKLTVQAQSWSEMMEDIGDTLDAILHELVGSNELDRFLQDHGWRLITPLPEKLKNVRFDVPFIPAVMERNDPPSYIHQQN